MGILHLSNGESPLQKEQHLNTFISCKFICPLKGFYLDKKVMSGYIKFTLI
jgi:hypothetical protein